MDYTGLKIENKEQFIKVYHLFRSSKTISSKEWLEKYNTPTFPIYLEKLGESYGYCTQPIGTFDKKPFNIINFNEYEN